ncbi:PREDICTED: uncharacterized protein LOC104814483 [Tarenaya hassleriana]|uniref:uncharacterized protein LOC104814483 n=1 Tax=Tarenaya hassleriana TaxID=28532 RepID=UPI00053C7891|nr:PREDICTED: uncharacterized protein LOC104814483 [Tarenaya hassleriana]
MKISSLQLHTRLTGCKALAKSSAIQSFILNPTTRTAYLRTPVSCVSESSVKRIRAAKTGLGPIPKSQILAKNETLEKSSDGYSRIFVMSGLSMGLMLLLLSVDAEKAMAFGPEGPLVEEFWDNVRRYALYALTVSTGAIYAVVEPILDLLKSPISAILILIILGGSIYIFSQVLSAMVGVSDFAYDYGY